MSIKFILFSSNCNESGPFSEITPIAMKNSGGLFGGNWSTWRKPPTCPKSQIFVIKNTFNLMRRGTRPLDSKIST
jgi:hypothetical protein